MFDRYDAGEQAVLVHIYFSQDKDMEDLQEFESLVSSAGVEAMQVITGSRKAPHPKYFVGEGKAVEIAEAVKATGASVVLFDHALSPAQERNLEQLCQCRVIDRTGLILDIFAQRARTHEGKLQVELAQLRHLATRLVRGWTHLERQKGGIGLRGPGETQLETDRRLLRNRIMQILSRLERVEKTARAGPSFTYESRYSDGVAGRLYQRREVHAIQPNYRSAGLRPPTSCSLRWIRRCAGLMSPT
ncbi:GTP-binding protein HflX [Pluralibacter gergoviae]|nr:GTP-binding protein HflX [Pluralibacter gergoviae]